MKTITAMFIAVIALLGAQVGTAGASTAAPVTYKSATVDGNASEWGGEEPLLMYEAGDPSKTNVTNAYLRYDCKSQTLYVLVQGLREDLPVLRSAEDAWASLGGPSNKKFTGSSGNDGVPPDFAWIESAGGDTVAGYEASFSIAEGTWADFVVHAQFLKSGEDSGTSANVGFRDVFGTTTLVLNCPEVSEGTLSVDKFYDANTNGAKESDEVLISDWRVFIEGGVFYTPYQEEMEEGTYSIEEAFPVESNWRATTATSFEAEVKTGEDTHVLFGNVCLGRDGGLTLGFWSNKNGQALISSDDLAGLRALNLKRADGSAFDPTSYSQLRNWLLGATAERMNYMLSAQLAALYLAVYNDRVDPDSYVQATGVLGANSADFMTVQDLIEEANRVLQDTAASRSYRETVKNALDWANNNRTFVQKEPCPFSFAE